MRRRLKISVSILEYIFPIIGTLSVFSVLRFALALSRSVHTYSSHLFTPLPVVHLCSIASVCIPLSFFNVAYSTATRTFALLRAMMTCIPSFPSCILERNLLRVYVFNPRVRSSMTSQGP